MTKFDSSNHTNPMGTVYHFVHPEHADLDLRIFRNMCLGKSDVQIATEQSCDCEAVYASVGRLKEYIRSYDMFSLVEIFLYVFSKCGWTVLPPQPQSPLSMSFMRLALQKSWFLSIRPGSSLIGWQH